MITSLFGYLKTGALLFLLNDYFKRNYPYDYEIFYVITTYNLINIYSRCQMLFKNSTQYITRYIREKHPNLINFIQSFFIKNNNIKNNLQFIKDSDIIKLGSKNDYLSNDEIIVTDCDLVIYSDYKEGHVNVKIINDANLLDKKETYDYHVTDYKFLLIEFMYNSNIYKINLSTDKYNFYIVDNNLDDKFFLYYLKYYLPIKEHINIENPKLIVKIIDDNVNTKIIELEKQYIQFGKTEYKIIDKN